MKKISKNIINQLCLDAYVNERKRLNYNIHDSYDEPVQKMFNACQLETILPIHRHLHPAKKETIVILQGKLRMMFYNDNKEQIDSFEMSPENIFIVEIFPNEWHNFLILEADTVVLSIKSGPYNPISQIDLL